MQVTTSPSDNEHLEAESGYGDLDLPPRRGGPRPLVFVGLAAVAAVVAAVVWVGLGRSDDQVEPSTSTSSTALAAASASTTTVEPGETTEGGEPGPGPESTALEIEVDGVRLGGDNTAQYVTEPETYEAGTVEGDIEVGFINSEVASIRALGNPTLEEPEVSYWKTGFTLRAIRDTQQILVEDGQVLIAGPLTFVGVLDITVRSDTEADLEYCALLHDYSVVVADLDDRIETVITRHAINRMTLGADGQWQNQELVSEIQVVDGLGPCLDAELTPVN